MTKEQEKISNRNKYQTIKYFEKLYDWYKNRGNQEYDLHHINPDWKETDVERYIQWNPEDLVIMTHSEHSRWHCLNTPIDYAIVSQKLKGRGHSHTEETKAKMSASRKGVPHNAEWNKKVGDANRGRKQSEETRRKNSEAHKKGYHWYTNGVDSVCTDICPDGYRRGRVIKHERKTNETH